MRTVFTLRSPLTIVHCNGKQNLLMSAFTNGYGNCLRCFRQILLAFYNTVFRVQRILGCIFLCKFTTMFGSQGGLQLAISQENGIQEAYEILFRGCHLICEYIYKASVLILNGKLYVAYNFFSSKAYKQYTIIPLAPLRHHRLLIMSSISMKRKRLTPKEQENKQIIKCLQ